MTPTAGKVGTRATLSIVSASFSLEGEYRIRWSPTATFDDNETIVLTKGNVPKGGHAVVAMFTVPEARYGVHYVQFSPSAGTDPVNLQFIVEPSLQVNPTSTQPGSVITLKGTGFPANDSGTVFFDDKPTNTRVATNHAGSFEVRLTAPATSSGQHKLFIDIPMMHVEAGIATIQVSSPDETTTSQKSPTAPAPGTKTDSEIKHTPIPIEDHHPPHEPMPIAPMGHSFGIWGAKEVTFSWSGVSDPSGVNYTLEIARNVDFDQLEAETQRTGLTETSYAATIEPGIYYWRVKAVDGAGNESYWGYAPCAFTVGELSYLIREFGAALKAVFSTGI